MSIALIREHYEYHQWANRRLFELASGLGDGVTRDMGKHWSFPTLKGTFAHIYGADHVWLTRWKGESPSRLRGDADFSSMDELRATWDAFEAEQRGFVTGLAEADLTRPVHYKNTQGQEFQVALGALLHQVGNHAPHHRSEAAPIITLFTAPPPAPGTKTYPAPSRKGCPRRGGRSWGTPSGRPGSGGASGHWSGGWGLLFGGDAMMPGGPRMVGAKVGRGAAGAAYIPALADFVPMVKGTSHMALGGPPLVKAVVGEEVSAEELGGSKVPCEISGLGNLEAQDPEHCLPVV